jgi:glycogen debranching enzyme
LVPGTGIVYVDAKFSVIRERAVGDGFYEELTILNHDREPLDPAVRVEVAADFADLFEVKDALQKKGSYSTTIVDGKIFLSYRRESFERATIIAATEPADVMRYGEMTAFEERPQSPYYGSADATPLFVVLLDEYERWTGDQALVREFEFETRAALTWIDQRADLQHNGYISYKRRNEKTGLENQCWKDSRESISFRDGSLPGFPRATCASSRATPTTQRCAPPVLARQIWRDPDYADSLEKHAADLKRRFNRDFWLGDDEYFAVALDADGRKVDSLTSNIGHLLWSGIVDRAKASAVVRHLMSERMFSGWGVRTLADGEGRYNPIGYHVGTVWPFGNSFIAWGLRRYGFNDEAAHVASGILTAANHFGGRLPEAFGGYPRDMTRYPVQYPTACSPQAWSTGAPLLLLRTMLGLEPIGDHMVSNPCCPR